MLEKAANALLFQMGWFACVLGGNSGWLVLVLAILMVHWAWHGDARLMLEAFVLGLVLDSALMWLKVFDFHPNGWLVPLWLALLWPLLASTLRYCLAWTARPWWLAALLGAVAGPLSYFAGGRLAGVGFPLGMGITLIILAVIWGGIFVILHKRATP
ncbi:hypothetical protein PMM47T1_22433 [Pseudomonas sp. M47T1]|uniref:DUF2878 domain-containing protein n=1 Tax=Pseudomonas sp. M47T1 TaxID=1179778 RepID=UPI00026068BD|nr:DUF2878 domain-containing protein [Pseudomonas sp. M47T1]EIK94354.1 hypothetical protein PMM47T1_22433 [Pseudomonas sp. M47T1]